MADEGDSGTAGAPRGDGGRVGGAARARPGSSADDGLLGAFLVGDDDGLRRARAARHEPLVLALVRRYARTAEDARDLAQRTFLRAFEAARRTLRRGASARASRSAAGSSAWR